MTSTTDRAMRRRPRFRLPFSGWHLLLMPLSLLFVLPLVQMVLTSFMSDSDINRFPPMFIPSHLHISGYVGLFTQSHILRWLINTVIVSAIAVGSHLILCSTAGYCALRPATGSRGCRSPARASGSS